MPEATPTRHSSIVKSSTLPLETCTVVFAGTGWAMVHAPTAGTNAVAGAAIPTAADARSPETAVV